MSYVVSTTIIAETLVAMTLMRHTDGLANDVIDRTKRTTS